MDNTPTTLFFSGWLKKLTQRTRRTDSQGRITLIIDRRTSVKDLIESFGVPHTEVGGIFVDEVEVAFDHIVDQANSIKVLPLKPPVDIFQPTLLQPMPPPAIKFLVDANVGKLASKLRMAGFDTMYPEVCHDAELAKIAEKEQRILLSKDIQLLKRKKVTHGHFVREIHPQLQLAEIIHFYNLQNQVNPFVRCMRCNGRLQPVAKDKIAHRLEPLTKKYYHDFHCCSDCDRIYWPGSHRQSMEFFINEIKAYQPLPY